MVKRDEHINGSLGKIHKGWSMKKLYADPRVQFLFKQHKLNNNSSKKDILKAVNNG